MSIRTRQFTAILAISAVTSGTTPGIAQQRTDATFCAVHQFGPSIPNTDGLWPVQPGMAALAPDGSVWTTTTQGGPYGAGTVIKVAVDGTYSKIADFNTGVTGASPQGGLTYSNGYMYGTTNAGGRWGPGTIFRISVTSANPSIEVLYDFRNGRPTGIQPLQCIAPNNCAYSPAQRRDMSGSYPISAPVVVGGMLYGVTSYSNNQQYGTMYSLPVSTSPRPAGLAATIPEDGDFKMHVLCMFQPSLILDPDMKDFRCSTNGTFAGYLYAAPDGTFYGTTMGGFGSVFSATSSGAITTLHTFNNTDGSKPLMIMQGGDGNLYGTTSIGGSVNWGVLYRLDPRTSAFTKLTDFAPPANNAYPQGNTAVAGVVEGPDHYLYGALRYGGRYGRGVIYRIHPDGSDYDIVHDFDFAYGRTPLSTPLLIGSAVYGTTYQGGSYDGGVLYRYRLDKVAITRGITLVNDGTIDVRAGARATQQRQQESTSIDPNQPVFMDKAIDDGISVRLKCDKDPHILQFIYREIIQPTTASVASGWENAPNGKLLSNSSLPAPCCQSLSGQYDLTTLPSVSINWSPDAIAKPSPFYDAGRQAEFDCESLALFDRPELAAAELAGGRVGRAIVRNYAMCGNQVVRQVTWISDQTVDAQGASHWKYQAAATSATKVPDYFLCMLQNSGYNLPIGVPGLAISAGTDCSTIGPAVLGKP